MAKKAKIVVPTNDEVKKLILERRKQVRERKEEHTLTLTHTHTHTNFLNRYLHDMTGLNETIREFQITISLTTT